MYLGQMRNFNDSRLINSAVCLMTGPQHFQSELFTKFELVLLLSIYNILSFPSDHIVGCHVFFLVFHSLLSFLLFPSLRCFRRQVLRKMQQIQLNLPLLIVGRIFISLLTLCHTPTFITLSVQLIYSINVQHHITNRSRHFRSTF